MTHQNCVYYKDKKNVFRFVDLQMQKVFNIQKQPSKVIQCQVAFLDKIEYG